MSESNVFNKKYGFTFAVLGLTALLLVLLITPPSDNQTNEDPVEVVTAPEKAVTETQPSTPPVPFNAIAPDLESPGQEFVLYNGIKDVLDNLILSADSTDKETIMALAQSWCTTQELSESGCADFEALFSRYIDYKIAMASHESLEGRPTDMTQQLRDRLADLLTLRYQWFSEEEVLALFGEDIQSDELALERRDIAMATDLTREQKVALINEHYRNLPEEQRTHLEPTLQMYDLEEIKQQYDDKQLRLLEVETKFGFEAAQRLEKTWQKQEDFQQKIDEIAEQYRNLQPEEGVTLKDQQLQFLQEHFSGNEARRARAILKTYNTDNG